MLSVVGAITFKLVKVCFIIVGYAFLYYYIIIGIYYFGKKILREKRSSKGCDPLKKKIYNG